MPGNLTVDQLIAGSLGVGIEDALGTPDDRESNVSMSPEHQAEAA